MCHKSLHRGRIRPARRRIGSGGKELVVEPLSRIHRKHRDIVHAAYARMMSGRAQFRVVLTM